MSLLNIPFTFGFGVYCTSQLLRSSVQTVLAMRCTDSLWGSTFHLSSVCEVCSSPNDSEIWTYPETRRLLTENRGLYIPSHPPALWFWGELAAGHQVHNLKFFRLWDDASEPATGWSPHLLTTQTMDRKSFTKGLKENTGSVPLAGLFLTILLSLNSNKRCFLGMAQHIRSRPFLNVLAKRDPNVLEAYKMSKKSIGQG